MKAHFYTVDSRNGMIHSRHQTEKAAYEHLSKNYKRNLKLTDSSDKLLSDIDGVVRYYREDLPLWSKFPVS